MNPVFVHGRKRMSRMASQTTSGSAMKLLFLLVLFAVIIALASFAAPERQTDAKASES
jgi:hypothetical protein